MKKKVLLSLLVFLVFLFQACSTNDLNALLSIQFSKQKTIPFFGLMMGTISVESYFANEIASLSVNGMFYPVSDRKGHFVIFDDVILEQKTSNSGLTFYNTFGDSIHMANYSFAFFSDEGIHRHYFEPAEGLYFIEEGYAYPWQLYQMDYIAGLNFDQRVTLYLNSVGSKKTVFVVLLQSGVLRFCEYSDYPFQGDEPTIEQGQQSGEFPQICLDVSRGRIPIDPANPDVIVNDPPCVSMLVAPDAVIGESEAYFEWHGEDKDGEISHYLFSKDDEDWQMIEEQSYVWSGFEPGEHIFSVKAVDHYGTESAVVSWFFVYEIPLVTLSVFSLDPELGSVRIGEGEWITEESTVIRRGSSVCLCALAHEGNDFNGWYDSGIFLSDAPVYEITVDEDRVISARFCEPYAASVVTLSDAIGSPWESFVIDVSARDVGNLVAFDLFIQYDPLVFEALVNEPDFAQLSGAASMMQFLKKAVVEPGLIWISAGSLSEPVELIDEVFLSVRLGAKGNNGHFPVTFSPDCLFVNDVGQVLDVLMVDGIITIR